MKKLILIIALALTMTACIGGEDKFRAEVVKEKEAVKLANETLKGGYGLLTVEELQGLIDKKTDMVIVDTMPYEASYKKNHIPSAVPFEFPIKPMATWNSADTAGKSEADYSALLGPDKDKLIVVYCGFVKCGRSDNGAVWAKKLGYTNVKRLPGGIFAWKGADYEVGSEG